MSDFLQIFKTTIPVLMGYVPLGAAFGLLATSMQIPLHYSILMSIVFYAGSGQFLALSLFGAGAGYVETFVSIFLLNLRHSFYGISIMNEYESVKKGKKYLIFSLTDETFALLKTLDIKEDKKDKYFFFISFFNQLYWIIGTIIGALIGAVLPFNYKGIEFSLTALFVVLSIEIYKKNPYKKALILAFLLGFLGLFLPSSQMLILTLSIALFFIILFGDLLE